jgi:hypothetical protein
MVAVTATDTVEDQDTSKALVLACAALAPVTVDKVAGGYAVLGEEYGLTGMLPGKVRRFVREYFTELKGNALSHAVDEIVAGYRTDSIRHATREYVKALRAGGVPAGKHTRNGDCYTVRVEIPRKRAVPVALSDLDKATAKVKAVIGKLTDTDKEAFLNRLAPMLPVGV